MKTTAEIIEQNQANIDAINELLDGEYCFKCNHLASACVCGMWRELCGSEPTVLKPGEHNRYEDGRAQSLQP